MSNITATNRMSLSEFKRLNGNKEIEIVRKANGKCFFTCGDKVGYVSPKAAECDDIDRLQYADVSIDGGEAVPTIMVKSANVLRTF